MNNNGIPRLLNRKALCDYLGVSVDWFARNVTRLVAERSFPGPVPGMGERYDRRAVELWLDAHIPAELLAAAAVDAPPDLDARAEQIGHRFDA